MVAATRLGFFGANRSVLVRCYVKDRKQTHLCHANDLAVRAPSCLFEVLGYLSGLSGACLTNDYGNGICLNDVQKVVVVFGNG